MVWGGLGFLAWGGWGSVASGGLGSVASGGLGSVASGVSGAGGTGAVCPVDALAAEAGRDGALTRSRSGSVDHHLGVMIVI